MRVRALTTVSWIGALAVAASTGLCAGASSSISLQRSAGPAADGVDAAPADGGSAATAAAGEGTAGPGFLCDGLWLSGGELRDAGSNVLLWNEPNGTVTSLACGQGAEGRLAAVGSTRPGRAAEGRIVLLAPGPDAGGPWTVRGEITTRGVPRRLLIARDRLAVALEGKKDFALGLADARPGAKVQVVILPRALAGLAVAPDGESFVVAVGNDLRTFRIDDGRTRTIVPFPEPIDAVASQRGVGRILVGQGRAVVAVDPRDKADRGLLPVRARIELPGPAADLAWLDEGRAAAVLVREPATVLILSGVDLGVLDRFENAADAIDAAGVQEVRWARGGSHKASGILRSAIEPPPAPPYVPAAPEIVAEASIPEPAAPLQELPKRVEPPPAKREAPPRSSETPPPPSSASPNAKAPSAPGKVEPPAAAPPARTEPPASPPQPVNTEPAPGKVEPAPAAPPAKIEAPPSPAPGPAKTEPAPATPPAKIEPPPSPAPAPTKTEPAPVAPPAKTEVPPTSPPPPAKEPLPVAPPAKVEPSSPPPSPAKPAPAPATTDPAPPAKTEPAPAKTERPPENSPPPTNEESASVRPDPTEAGAAPQGNAASSPLPSPAEGTLAPGAPSIPEPAPPPPSAARGGTIVGTITGRLDLVDEIVVLGPDSMMKQFARVKVTSSGGSGQFDLGQVPAGRYVVTPMGAHGASLSVRPAAARVVVTSESGARVDFEILGAL